MSFLVKSELHKFDLGADIAITGYESVNDFDDTEETSVVDVSKKMFKKLSRLIVEKAETWN